jgi:hypothetical protein
MNSSLYQSQTTNYESMNHAGIYFANAIRGLVGDADNSRQRLAAIQSVVRTKLLN